MLVLSIRRQARQDVEDIGVYFAELARSYIPDQFLDGVEVAFDFLLTSPKAGRLCGFSGDSRDIRSWPVKGFPKLRIFYRVDGDQLNIVRVLNGSRDVEAIFG
jgi:toxin ParE1/3/4